MSDPPRQRFLRTQSAHVAAVGVQCAHERVEHAEGACDAQGVLQCCPGPVLQVADHGPRDAGALSHLLERQTAQSAPCAQVLAQGAQGTPDGRVIGARKADIYYLEQRVWSGAAGAGGGRAPGTVGGVLRAVSWTLRQRRYRALAALMLVVALACVGAGTFEITRFVAKVRENRVLTANAHAAPVPLGTALVPLVGHGPAPDKYAIRYRSVTVTGSYVRRVEFVRNQTLNGVNGFNVLSPLRTHAGVLLVVRGFVAADASGAVPRTVGAAPQGQVRLTGRLQTAETKPDDAGQLADGQLESVNPAEQAARLGSPVFDAYLGLDPGQPGGAGLSPLAAPDLSNPAGGAYSWQHLAYVIQWYLFALLALAAPFAFSRHEAREAAQRVGIDPDAGLGAAPQRPQLSDGSPGDGGLVVRDAGTLARRTTTRQAQTARLADRYGLPLAPPPIGQAETSRQTAADVGESSPSAGRTTDAYHASYNDHLWLLALADGSAGVGPGDAARRGALDGAQPDRRDAQAPRALDERDDLDDRDDPAPERT